MVPRKEVEMAIASGSDEEDDEDGRQISVLTGPTNEVILQKLLSEEAKENDLLTLLKIEGRNDEKLYTMSQNTRSHTIDNEAVGDSSGDRDDYIDTNNSCEVPLHYSTDTLMEQNTTEKFPTFDKSNMFTIDPLDDFVKNDFLDQSDSTFLTEIREIPSLSTAALSFINMHQNPSNQLKLGKPAEINIKQKHSLLNDNPPKKVIHRRQSVPQSPIDVAVDILALACKTIQKYTSGQHQSTRSLITLRRMMQKELRLIEIQKEIDIARASKTTQVQQQQIINQNVHTENGTFPRCTSTQNMLPTKSVSQRKSRLKAALPAEARKKSRSRDQPKSIPKEKKTLTVAPKKKEQRRNIASQLGATFKRNVRSFHESTSNESAPAPFKKTEKALLAKYPETIAQSLEQLLSTIPDQQSTYQLSQSPKHSAESSRKTSQNPTETYFKEHKLLEEPDDDAASIAEAMMRIEDIKGEHLSQGSMSFLPSLATKKDVTKPVQNSSRYKHEEENRGSAHAWVKEPLNSLPRISITDATFIMRDDKEAKSPVDLFVIRTDQKDKVIHETEEVRTPDKPNQSDNAFYENETRITHDQNLSSPIYSTQNFDASTELSHEMPRSSPIESEIKTVISPSQKDYAQSQLSHDSPASIYPTETGMLMSIFQHDHTHQSTILSDLKTIGDCSPKKKKDTFTRQSMDPSSPITEATITKRLASRKMQTNMHEKSKHFAKTIRKEAQEMTPSLGIQKAPIDAEIFFDPSSGAPYYFDILTGQSVWLQPDQHDLALKKGFKREAVGTIAVAAESSSQHEVNSREMIAERIRFQIAERVRKLSSSGP